MKAIFPETLAAFYRQEKLVVMTGDVGFRMLEGLQRELGGHFINAGVAEQNMCGVAAGLARTGLQVWVYSIAPFLYARAFEQIRNDICLHRLRVKLVGNGGGYGYGILGPTHHSLEEYGVLLSLPGMRVFVPAFRQDVPPIMERMRDYAGPAYLRTCLCENPPAFEPPAYAPWRKLMEGEKGMVIVLGAIAGALLSAWLTLPPKDRPSLWVVSELPLGELPEEVKREAANTASVCVVEEHIAQGGLGQALTFAFQLQGVTPKKLQAATALGYPSGLYGGQNFHRRESGLTPEAILQLLEA